MLEGLGLANDSNLGSAPLGRPAVAAQWIAVIDDCMHSDQPCESDAQRADDLPAHGFGHGSCSTRYTEQRSAWDNWVRGGMEGLSAEQRSMVLQMRAQGTTPSEAGGFTVPTTLQARVIESLVTYGGIASVCQLLQTDNGAPIAWATSNGGEEEGELIGENKAAGEKDVEFGIGTLGSHTISSKIIRVSEQLLQDSGIDMEAFLAGRIGKRVSRTRRHARPGQSRR